MSYYYQELPGAYQQNSGQGLIQRAHVTERSRSTTIKTTQHAQRRTNPAVFLPPTPMSAFERKSDMFQGSYADVFGNTGSGVRESRPDQPVADPWMLDLLDAKATNKALAAIKAQDVNFAQAFAERAQTASLVADSATRLAKAIWRLRHGDLRGCADTLGITTRTRMKGVGNTWLELQYGWKPLLSDVHGAVEALRQRDADFPSRYRFCGKGSSRDKSSEKYSKLSGDILETGYLTLEHGVFVRLDVCLDSQLMASLAAAGFTNPLSVAWEVVPFSFIADWFMPIGEYLNLKDAMVGYQFLGGSTTRRFYGSRSGCEQRRIGEINAYLKHWHYHSGFSSYKTVERRVHATPPSSQLPVKNPMSMGHVANALALLQAAVRGVVSGGRRVR